MHLRNFGSDKIVRTYGRPPLHVSWGETLHFKHPARSVVNRMATWTLREREKKQQQDSRVFFRQNFNAYIKVGNQERAKARNTQQRRPILLEEKREKMRNASGQLG